MLFDGLCPLQAMSGLSALLNGDAWLGWLSCSIGCIDDLLVGILSVQDLGNTAIQEVG